jgi:hypothetical protein
MIHQRKCAIAFTGRGPLIIILSIGQASDKSPQLHLSIAMGRGLETLQAAKFD